MVNNESSSNSGNDFTLEDLRCFDFERVLSRQSDDAENTEDGTCQRYSASFIEETKIAAREGDQKKERICELFATLTSPRFYFNDIFKRPFPPPNIDEQHLGLLRQFAPEIKDRELQARIADILWTLRVERYFQFGELAVDSYLEVAAGFDSVEASHDRYMRIERALQISARLGKAGQRFSTVIDFIETALTEMKVAGILRGPAPLLRLLCEHGKGDSRVYIPYATELAEVFEKENAWEGARAVWEVARDWHLLAKDDKAARCAERRAAMTYELEAIAWMKESPDAHFKAVHLLQHGLVALRQTGAPKTDIDRVHALLLETQASYDGFQTISHSADISELVQSAKRSFRDRPLMECIYGLAADYRPPSVESLEAHAKELQDKHALQYFINMERLDEEGKVIGRRPGFTYEDSNGISESIRCTMYDQATFWQRLRVFGFILPALEQINLDHLIRPDDIVAIVANNPFVPPDRREIFLRGLYHGFVLDFMVASSLLVPQIESSIRYLLKQRGVITSKFESDGIQEEYGLGNLLYSVPEVSEIFDPDILFDMQGLLLERLGANFRNRLAHGLVTDDEYASWRGAYAWWLILYLCCAPLLARQAAARDIDTDREDNQKAGDETPDSTSA